MPKDVTSPFTPGTPVPLEFFVGRRDEIERLLQKMKNALTGRVEAAFVAGERGIGKSSLVSFVRFLSERDLGVLGIHAFMGGVQTVEEAVRRVFDKLVKEKSSDASAIERIRTLFGKHVQEVGLFGATLSFEADEHDLKALVHGFAPALQKLLEEMGEKKKGILLILDDINGLAKSEDFANWLKSLVDEISVSTQRLPICIVLVGLDERRRALVQIQPSLARVLDVIDIAVWSNDETRGFFGRAFGEVGVTCRGEALDTLTRFTGGLPMLAHEIGDATFRVDADGDIDKKDALAGIVRAAEVVGRKHIDPLVYDSIRSKQYRTILRKIARELFAERFSRSEARAHLADDEIKVFDDFIRRMKKLGVVLDDPEGGRGSYRFSTRLHHVYIALEAEHAEEQQA